ncbi:uncharacterized protein CLUP02_01300 [Colletotrichum lupini]|uniref:Uncharacterized protein n=1 Tax=Colletotrichum lupini TaxID=145971 RepID=A0A9Q8W919_9PEZI|nr:uncharacterized protein CLUP02_01300 [Colletotrichum lupini]UQC74649.1 hypothetical protein CLUP02_01300 [Colletotrichum lupini]
MPAQPAPAHESAYEFCLRSASSAPNCTEPQPLPYAAEGQSATMDIEVLSAEPRGQQTNKMEFAFSIQHGPAADRCNGISTHSVTLFANVSTRSPRHAAETLPSL